MTNAPDVLPEPTRFRVLFAVALLEKLEAIALRVLTAKTLDDALGKPAQRKRRSLFTLRVTLS